MKCILSVEQQPMVAIAPKTWLKTIVSACTTSFIGFGRWFGLSFLGLGLCLLITNIGSVKYFFDGMRRMTGFSISFCTLKTSPCGTALLLNEGLNVPKPQNSTMSPFSTMLRAISVACSILLPIPDDWMWWTFPHAHRNCGNPHVVCLWAWLFARFYRHFCRQTSWLLSKRIAMVCLP